MYYDENKKEIDHYITKAYKILRDELKSISSIGFTDCKEFVIDEYNQFEYPIDEGIIELIIINYVKYVYDPLDITGVKLICKYSHNIEFDIMDYIENKE